MYTAGSCFSFDGRFFKSFQNSVSQMRHRERNLQQFSLSLGSICPPSINTYLELCVMQRPFLCYSSVTGTHVDKLLENLLFVNKNNSVAQHRTVLCRGDQQAGWIKCRTLFNCLDEGHIPELVLACMLMMAIAWLFYSPKKKKGFVKYDNQ